MSSNLKKCMQKLIIISKIKNPSIRKKVLLSLYDECLYKAFYEIAANTVSKNIPLKRREKNLLKKHKIILQKLACYTKSKKRRKTLVAQSGGGFLSILIPAIASIITSLIAK